MYKIWRRFRKDFGNLGVGRFVEYVWHVNGEEIEKTPELREERHKKDEERLKELEKGGRNPVSRYIAVRQLADISEKKDTPPRLSTLRKQAEERAIVGRARRHAAEAINIRRIQEGDSIEDSPELRLMGRKGVVVRPKQLAFLKDLREARRDDSRRDSFVAIQEGEEEEEWEEDGETNQLSTPKRRETIWKLPSVREELEESSDESSSDDE